jgi:hypothetical protein
LEYSFFVPIINPLSYQFFLSAKSWFVDSVLCNAILRALTRFFFFNRMYVRAVAADAKKLDDSRNGSGHSSAVVKSGHWDYLVRTPDREINFELHFI